MWLVIIVIVVLVIIYVSYFSQRTNRLQTLEKMGGLEVLYSTLINYLASTGKSQIIKKSSDRIEVISNSGLIKHNFTIVYLLNKVSVIWIGTLYNGEVSTKTWRFPSTLEQNQMIEIISNELPPLF